MSAERLEGQVIIVTGAGRGIGAAVARDLATRGAQLVLDDNGSAADGTGNDPSIIDAITKETHGLGAEAVSSTIDVAARGGCTALVELALDSFGRLDGVVNSAGVQRDRGVLHVTDEDLDAFLGTHIRAGFELTRVAARAMIDRGEGGSIIHMTSPAAFFGSARKAGASAAAAAIVGLTRSAAVELRKHAVRVNAVAPTARTRTTEELPLFKGMRDGSMTAEHVAPVVAFLLGPDARDVSGEVVGVAGGRLYALRARETTGAFSEGRPFTVEDIKAAWDEATRGSTTRG